jgi:hypothetical protein
MAPSTGKPLAGDPVGTRSAGPAQATNGVDKIICPLNFALFAGANNIVTPQAVSVAVLLAYLFGTEVR